MRSFAVAICLLVGCEDTPRPAPVGPVAPASTVATDALWALAPQGARGGIVASPRAVGLAEDSFAMVRGFFDGTPELAPIKRELDEMLERTGGSSKLADWGFTRDKGAALFLLHDGMVAILPVANRDMFLAKVKGTKGATDADTIDDTTCKTIRGVYACATTAALLDTLGKGDLKARLAKAGARGELEVVGVELPFTDDRTGAVAAVLQLARGSLAIRGAVEQLPADVTAKLGKPTRPRTDRTRSSGFGVIDLRPYLADTPDVPVVGDITFSQLVATIAGPLTINVPAGEATLDMELPLADPTPMRTVVGRCTEFPPLAELGAKVLDGACHVKIPDSAIDLEVWVDGTTLRIGKRGAKVAGKHVPMSPIGGELASTDWSLRVLGPRHVFGPAPIEVTPPASELTPDAAVAIRLTTLIDEAGIGAKLDGDVVRFVLVLRTAFANPDPVLTRLLAITADDLVQGRAPDRAAPIARSAPRSPFAHDFTAGQSGMIIPTSLLGMAVSVVLPRFLAAVRPAPAEDEP